MRDPSTHARCSTAQSVATTTAQTPVVVIGAGPGGLTAALELAELGVPVLVIEANQRVGGLAQTVEYKGFRFDIGGHRFFTKVHAVRELWRSMLGADFLKRPRLSRILFDGKFFDYPLKPADALFNLGVFQSTAILASYLWVKVRPVDPEVSFEDWVTNRFGRRLFRLFFKTYTEKVWGIPCRTISARWAAQRIQGLSLKTAVINMLAPWLNRRPGKQVKTLVDEFEYPRLGPGMMWEAFAARVEQLGGSVILNARVVAVQHDGRTVQGVEIQHADGRRVHQAASNIISTMPLTHLVRSLGPTATTGVQEAALSLKYRDFITVAVVVDRPDLFPDNWIYIHDPSVKVGRIQNFKNWSADMVPDPSKTCLGLEYFCSAGDAISSLSNDQLMELAKAELEAIGLVDRRRIVDATVVRVPKAYPVYDEDYDKAVKAIRAYLSGFANLQTIGRNGTHTYNNQDHSMVMGMLAVRNLFGDEHDVWSIDQPDEYLEELHETGTPSLGLDGRTLASTQPLFPPLVRAREAFEPR
jgi:protoporphyrinogen oxidase